ncbi:MULTISPECIES: SDR family oxidoreductase [unclassified Mesorhizobium]|uniref:SDR family NAD(P)-dependent oxidoreductase n=1 Tax=unclassified Mesorhizobium TaxID=325217 RepID=UPI00112778EF|nr:MULTISPECIES: SDR family oxidoreductase [unclassified Mesorhizobium]TPL02102.1 SDR family oxidoreductase [Mesorhizobium sp. B2-4-16]TPL78362.1 SDR family oxidoreductase [Mesorhizobium sp. B2-4-3]
MPQDEIDTQNALLLARRFSMAGRRALVTGGSVSIGREIVRVFAEAGADVAIHSAGAADIAFGQPDAAEEAVREVRERGRRGVAIEADFAEPGEATRCVEEAIGALGGVDVLVVCASIQYRTPFLELPADQVERQIQINFRATIELLQAALPGMKDNGWGRVLTIGSINQTRPESDLAVYAALKSAQHNLSFNLAKDYAPHGVTINNLSPGLVITERNRWRRQDAAKWADIQKNSAPMRRAGEASEMAGAALLLCSDAGSFITGIDLQATGGRHLGWQ